MDDRNDETKTGYISVDQGADNLETPRALYTPCGDLPWTCYEPKPSSTWVVGGTAGPFSSTMEMVDEANWRNMDRVRSWNIRNGRTNPGFSNLLTKESQLVVCGNA